MQSIPLIKAELEDILFELNDESTRMVVRSRLTSFLSNIQARRGITGYRVKCDTGPNGNNQPEDIDSFRLRVWYFIKPTPDIEEIEQRSIITPQSITFDDALLIA